MEVLYEIAKNLDSWTLVLLVVLFIIMKSTIKIDKKGIRFKYPGEWTLGVFQGLDKLAESASVQRIQSTSHLHFIIADCCFSRKDIFTKGPSPAVEELETWLRSGIHKSFKVEHKLSDSVIVNLVYWHHGL